MDNNVTPLPTDVRKLSLYQLVKNRQEVMEIVAQNEGEVSDELDQVLKMANELIEKKIDNVAMFRKVMLPNAKEALKRAYEAQCEKLDKLEDWLDELVFQAIKMDNPEAKDICGVMWRIRIQKNPAKVEITNPELIPDLFKGEEMIIKMKYPKAVRANLMELKLWDKIEDVCAIVREQGGKADFDSSKIFETIDKDAIKYAGKVPGAEMVRGEHLRYEEGKSNVGDIIKTEKKTRKKKGED